MMGSGNKQNNWTRFFKTKHRANLHAIYFLLLLLPINGEMRLNVGYGYLVRRKRELDIFLEYVRKP